MPSRARSTGSGCKEEAMMTRGTPPSSASPAAINFFFIRPYAKSMNWRRRARGTSRINVEGSLGSRSRPGTFVSRTRASASIATAQADRGSPEGLEARDDRGVQFPGEGHREDLHRLPIRIPRHDSAGGGEPADRTTEGFCESIHLVRAAVDEDVVPPRRQIDQYIVDPVAFRPADLHDEHVRMVTSHRMQAEELEPHRLRIPGDEVHALDRGACRALHQVVQGRDRDDPTGVGIEGEADVAEIGPREDLRFGEAVQSGRLRHDPHERLLTIGVAVDFPKILCADRIFEE